MDYLRETIYTWSTPPTRSEERYRRQLAREGKDEEEWMLWWIDKSGLSDKRGLSVGDSGMVRDMIDVGGHYRD